MLPVPGLTESAKLFTFSGYVQVARVIHASGEGVGGAVQVEGVGAVPCLVQLDAAGAGDRAVHRELAVVVGDAQRAVSLMVIPPLVVVPPPTVRPTVPPLAVISLSFRVAVPRCAAVVTQKAPSMTMPPVMLLVPVICRVPLPALMNPWVPARDVFKLRDVPVHVNRGLRGAGQGQWAALENQVVRVERDVVDDGAGSDSDHAGPAFKHRVVPVSPWIRCRGRP